MGEEKPLSANDFNFDIETSLASFLEYVVPLLNKYDNTVLRLHMGENQTSYTNPLDSLKLIKAVVKKHKLVIPPPYIRLGHAIYFDYQSSYEYVDLLHELGVVVEINASSNISLSSIDRLINLPYAFYRTNDVPVVIASDGAGLHRTTARQENLIGEKVDPSLPKFLEYSESVPGVFKK